MPLSDFCPSAVKRTNTRSWGKTSCCSHEKYSMRIFPRKLPHQFWLPHKRTRREPAWICICLVLLIHKYLNNDSHICGVNTACIVTGNWGIEADGNDILKRVSMRNSARNLNLSVEACFNITAMFWLTWGKDICWMDNAFCNLSIADWARLSCSCSWIQSW